MTNKIRILLPIIALLAAELFLSGTAGAQYRVSGIVDFSYRNYESRSGNGPVFTDSTFLQNYQTALQGYVWDPRFLDFSAGVGYSIVSNNNGNDSTMLTYNLNANFFPGMRVSWDIFGNKGRNTVQSASNIVGNDIDSSSYGGTLYFRAAGSNGNGNRNNNNNNNSGYRRSISQYLPDIMLSRIHTESESPSLSNPIHQTRDDTKASLAFRGNAAYDINLDGGLEQYEDLVNHATYEVKSANFSSNARLTPEADLKLSAGTSDRNTENMAGFLGSEKTSSYGMTLDFHPQVGLRHFYRYNYQSLDNTTTQYDAATAEAQLNYQLMDSILIRGELITMFRIICKRSRRLHRSKI